MWKDEIVEEVTKNREDLFAMFDFDINKFSQFIFGKQKEHKKNLITKSFKNRNNFNKVLYES